MNLEAYMGPNNQSQNQQVSEEILQFLNTVIISGNEGSSMLGDLSDSAVQMPQQDAPLVPGDRNISLQNNTTNARSSADESSMLTVADNPFSGGPYLPTIGNNSAESRTSNCGKLPCPPTRDQFPALQQTFQEGPTYPNWCATQGDHILNTPFTPQFLLPGYQAPVPLINFKKPRFEMQQEDILQGYPQLPSPSQVPMQLNGLDPMASAKLFYQNFLRNQLQNQTPLPVSTPLSNQMPCLPPYPLPVISQKQMAGITSMNGSICHRRLMYFLRDQRNRPADNNISFWRGFVDRYYSPGVKRRWCLSNCHNVGCHANNIFSHTTPDTWKCDFCGSKLEKGFEATFDVLPRISQVYFESGIIDELLYLDLPVEKTLPSGFVVLWYGKAVQESVYKYFRVVHEGQLRIVFTRELKIISWDFCIQRHEEFVSRRPVITQINQLLEEVAKPPNNFEGITAQDMLSNCNRVAAAGPNLVTNMVPLIVDDVGFPKIFVRHLQMSDTLHCMKNLMTESRTSNLGPIETLNRYSQEAANEETKHVEVGAQMQGTPIPDGNYQVANIVSQSPSNAGEQQAMINPSVYYPIQPLMEEQRMTLNSMSAMQNPFGPSTSQQISTKRQIDEILASMQAEAAGKCSKTTSRGKRRVMYDPKNTENSQILEFGDKTSKGKGFNYSSSSNSSAMDFTDKYMVKREPESDGDSTSPACYQGNRNLRTGAISS